MEGRAAVLSDCGLYRYELVRMWDGDLPLMTWLMLNPSTADAKKDDPTIRKCIGFAKRGEFGGILVVNLFAYRATNPLELVGKVSERDYRNLRSIEVATQYAKASGLPIFAGWGRYPIRLRDDVTRVLNDIGRDGFYSFGTTKDGEPRHPLMLSYAVKAAPWLIGGGS